MASIRPAKFKEGDIVRHKGLPGSVYLVEKIERKGRTYHYLMKKLYSTLGFPRAWDYNEDAYSHVSPLEKELW